MSTTIYLTQIQINQIRALSDAGPNAQGNYSHIYKLIGDMLPSGVVQNWFRGAEQANSGNGAYSALIRGYTKRQMELRDIGDSYTDLLMQTASNKIAERAFIDILNPARNLNNGYWTFPSINEIAANDAIAVGEVLFDPYLAAGDTARSGLLGAGGFNSGWAGTLFFSSLGSDQTWRLIEGSGVGLNSLDDLKNILFAYDALRAGLNEALTAGFDQPFKDLSILGITAWEAGLDDLLALAFNKISSLFSGAAQSVGKLIEGVGVNGFLDMIIGAQQGKPVYGSTTDANFLDSTQAYLSALTPTQIQNISVELMPTTVSEIVAKSKVDVNARAALVALSSVAVQTSTTIAANLDLYDITTGIGEISDQYLKDRAAMLSAKMTFDSGAKDYDDVLTNYLVSGLSGLITGLYRNKTYTEDWDSLTISGDWKYVDKSSQINGSDLSLFIDGLGDSLITPDDDHQIIFGSENSETLSGGVTSDRLYGMSGIDTLVGGLGSDYLEGGQGDDIYEFYSSDFQSVATTDIILDTDSLGSIKIDNVALPTFLRGANNVWYTSNNAYNATISGSGATAQLTLIHMQSGSRIIVKD